MSFHGVLQSKWCSFFLVVFFEFLLAELFRVLVCFSVLRKLYCLTLVPFSFCVCSVLAISFHKVFQSTFCSIFGGVYFEFLPAELLRFFWTVDGMWAECGRHVDLEIRVQSLGFRL